VSVVIIASLFFDTEGGTIKGHAPFRYQGFKIIFAGPSSIYKYKLISAAKLCFTFLLSKQSAEILEHSRKKSENRQVVIILSLPCSSYSTHFMWLPFRYYQNNIVNKNRH
jgi:hypothetical protein